MRPLPVHAEVRGAVVSPEGVPQLPTREEYEASKALLRKQAPAAIAGGGAIIADAYSEVEVA